MRKCMKFQQMQKKKFNKIITHAHDKKKTQKTKDQREFPHLEEGHLPKQTNKQKHIAKS